MSPTSSRKRLGEVLIERGLITPGQLREALILQKTWGTRLGDIVLARGWGERDKIYQALADHYQTVYLDLEMEPPDPSLFRARDARSYADLLLLPWGRIGGQTWVVAADPSPAVEEFVHSRFGRDVYIALGSRFEILYHLQQLAGELFSDLAIHGLQRAKPQHSASTVLTSPQLYALYGAVSLFLFGLCLFPLRTLMLLNAAMTAFIVFTFGFKFLLAWVGSDRSIDLKVTDEEVRALDEATLPTYTILVPMYKEPEVLPILASALRRMDYPLSRLDIKLVLEADDAETIAAAQALHLEGIFEIVCVPHSALKTKPKACNYALRFSRGELLTIYDAEDKPEPDQLKKVVIAFRKSDARVVCIQARLNYYNAGENWLTRMFTLEYSIWFDFYLPALEALKIPIPLGGTSNHFKMRALREVHAWDPFNVTEDADLGTRLTQLGYRVGVVNSTTLEEANSRIRNWIRQRSRWLKGYMQTYLVHMRNPWALYRSLGFVGFFGFQFFIGGTFLSPLIAPVLYGSYFVWLFTHTRIFEPLFPDYLLFPSLLNLVIGNAFFIYINSLGAYKRRLYRLIPWALTSPVYWMLQAIAGYKAAGQLFTNPFYWEKTAHGISKFTAAERDAACAHLQAPSPHTSSSDVRGELLPAGRK